MHKIFVQGLVILLFLSADILLLGSCEKDDNSTDNDNNEVADGINHEETSDYTWDSSSEIIVALQGNTIITNSTLVMVSGSVAAITSSGNYRISGTLNNGQVIVDANKDDVVRLIFDGVTISNNSSSAVIIEKSAKTIIHLVDGTISTISDASAYSTSDDDLNAALFSKSDLTIFGEGTLVVKGNYNDGIASKDGLVLKSGTYSVTSKDDGIRGKDYLIIHGGSYSIASGGDGLVSDNDLNSNVGYITIDDGDFNITSTDDCISAYTNLSTGGDGTYTLRSTGSISSLSSSSSKALKGLSSIIIDGGDYIISSTDDAIHSNNRIVINSGIIQASSSDDGIHAESAVEINGGYVKITNSYEAIESLKITINGGDIYVNATNDAINATAGTVSGGTEQVDNSTFAMNGGMLYASCANGDAMDSNGNVIISGGTVIVNGPASGIEEAADINGSFNMNGGLFIGAGTNSNMNKTMSQSSTQKNLYIISQRTQISQGSIFHLQDADGKDIVTFTPARAYFSILFSSPSLTTGVTYSIYTGGSCDGTVVNGLYSGGNYTGGTSRKSFTLSSTSSVTSVSL